ncbi:MAG: hypothetical protein K2M42_02845 [Oscillospiraceae bacterium]|nr:hypothetical protein [Oscillospiraceae bacterium]
MNETLKTLYDRFYTPLPIPDARQEIEDAHHQLIQRLGKSDRKLVLRIIDAKDHIAAEQSIDSFICGFELAWKLSSELNSFDESRPADRVGRLSPK